MRSDEPGLEPGRDQERAPAEDNAIARDLSTLSDAELVEPDEVARLREEGATLVDLRDPQAFARARIAGAINVPAEKLMTGAAQVEGAVILYDDDGSLVARRCGALRDAVGEMEFFVLKGGLRAWQDAGLPLEHG